MTPDIEAILRAILQAGLDVLPVKTARVQSYIESVLWAEKDSLKRIWEIYKSGKLSEQDYKELLERLRERLEGKLFFEDVDNRRVITAVIREFDQILHGSKPPDFP